MAVKYRVKDFFSQIEFQRKCEQDGNLHNTSEFCLPHLTTKILSILIYFFDKANCTIISYST